MNYKLKNPINNSNSTIEQILLNRGIKKSDIQHYLHTTDNDINDYASFGEYHLKSGLRLIEDVIENNKSMLVVVDSDCDGFTSAALWINYFYLAFPEYYSNIHYYIHSGKQHGLNDCMNEALKYDIVVLPDSSSNDMEYHQKLAEKGIQILVMDHHEADYISEDAIIINNQLSEYPNKDLSGVGVTWQFCRVLDNYFNKDFSNRFLDLVALGMK